MSDIQLYLLEVDSNRTEAVALAKKTANSLEHKQLKLLDLIQSLGEFLNNDNGSIQGKTMAYLADVLEALPSKVLSRQQRDLLNDFILSRISHGAEGTIHCARGLQALEKLGNFDHERVVTIVNTLLEHTHPLVQLKLQAERFEVLRLLDLIFLKYRKALQAFHDENKDFLSRFISYFDGEKDPRNLMIVFSIFNVLMVEWDVSNDAQDCFDAVFNYFPITFRPPPNDPYGITAQDLKDRLRDCIASTGTFAPYSFPTLLDKLDSTAANVKRDTLQAIKACVARYGSATMNLYAVTLWDAVKFEILNAEEEDLTEAALHVLYEIAYQLSFSPHEGPLQAYLKPICKECDEHLEDTPTKQSSAAGKILGSISSASAEASGITTRAAVPQILQLYKISDSIARRRGLLEVLINVIQSNAVVFGRWREDESTPSAAKPPAVPKLRVTRNTLEDFSEQCLDVLSAAVRATPAQEVSFRLLALEGLQGLAVLRNILSEDDISQTCRLLNDLIIHEAPHGKDEVKAKSMEVMVTLAHHKPQKIIEYAIPAFMATLPDSDIGATKDYVSVLEAFAKLSGESQVFGTVILRLKNKLYAALRQQASSKYIVSILSAMLYALINGAVDVTNPAIFGKYYQDIVIPLLKDVIASGAQTFPASPALRDETVHDLIGRISNIIVRPQPWVAQTELCRNVYTIFRTDDILSVPPFKAATTPDDSLTLITSPHLLAALQTQAAPHADIPALLTALIAYSQSSDLGPTVFSALLTQISLVVNKYIPASQTSSIISPLLSTDIPSSLVTTTNQTSSINLCIAFAVLKALILRIDPQLPSILPSFLALLDGPSNGTQTARLISQLLTPDAALTKENHCRIYALHRARLFTLLTPQLVSHYRVAASTDPPTSSTQQVKENVLIALAGFVQHVPFDLLRPELESVTPLIMQSLALPDAEVKSAAIATIARIVTEGPAVLEGHVGSLVSRLLGVVVAEISSNSSIGKRSTSFKFPGTTTAPTATSPSTPPRTRAAALATLATLPGSLKDESLLPYQRQVVRRLAAALDDRRRTVRAEAVRCRSAWAGLAGAANEGDDE